MIQAEEMENRGVEIVDGDAIGDGVWRTELVGRAESLTAFDAAARHPHRVAVGL